MKINIDASYNFFEHVVRLSRLRESRLVFTIFQTLHCTYQINAIELTKQNTSYWNEIFSSLNEIVEEVKMKSLKAYIFFIELCMKNTNNMLTDGIKKSKQPCIFIVNRFMILIMKNRRQFKIFLLLYGTDFCLNKYLFIL